MPTIQEKTKARSKAGATTTEATTKRKPRADKGKKRAPGLVKGRPVGTGTISKPELVARMFNIHKWLLVEKDVIKASGVALRAGLTARVLQTMRDGERVLTEAEIAALESAAKPRGYNSNKTY